MRRDHSPRGEQIREGTKYQSHIHLRWIWSLRTCQSSSHPSRSQISLNLGRNQANPTNTAIKSSLNTKCIKIESRSIFFLTKSVENILLIINQHDSQIHRLSIDPNRSSSRLFMDSNKLHKRLARNEAPPQPIHLVSQTVGPVQ